MFRKATFIPLEMTPVWMAPDGERELAGLRRCPDGGVFRRGERRAGDDGAGLGASGRSLRHSFLLELIFFLLLCQYESPQLNPHPHPYILGVTTLKIKRGYYRVFSKASLALIGPRSSAIMTRRCQNQEQMFSEQTQPNCVAAPRPSSQPPLRAPSAATRVTCPRAP